MLQQFYTLLNFNFMIYIIHKISVSFKITWITLKIRLLNAFSRRRIDYFLNIFYTTYNYKMFKAWKRQKIEEDLTKDVKNPFRPKK